MKLSKRQLIKELKTRCFDIEIEYNGKFGSVIPDYKNKDGYFLAFEGKYLDVDTIKDVMNVKFFDGNSLKDIYKQVDFSY